MLASKSFAAVALVALATPLLGAGGSPVGSGAESSHSWTSATAGEGETITTGQGTKVTKQGAKGKVAARWCPGKQSGVGAHGPHEEIDIDNKAKATVTGASGGSGGSDVNVGDGCNVTIHGNGFGTPGTDPSGSGIDITGNGSEVTYNGNSSDIEFSKATSGNTLTVNGNSNDIDLNGTDNKVIANGNGNHIHN